MKWGRTLAGLVFLWAAGSAADEPCRPDGRSAATADRPCAGKSEARPARRSSRARVVGDGIESVVQPKQLARPPAAPAAAPPMQPAPPLPAPAPITACDPNGCLDSSGTRYNGWGPGMIRSDGKLCQQVGNMMQCN